MSGSEQEWEKVRTLGLSAMPALQPEWSSDARLRAVVGAFRSACTPAWPTP